MGLDAKGPTSALTVSAPPPIPDGPWAFVSRAQGRVLQERGSRGGACCCQPRAGWGPEGPARDDDRMGPCRHWPADGGTGRGGCWPVVSKPASEPARSGADRAGLPGSRGFKAKKRPAAKQQQVQQAGKENRSWTGLKLTHEQCSWGKAALMGVFAQAPGVSALRSKAVVRPSRISCVAAWPVPRDPLNLEQIQRWGTCPGKGMGLPRDKIIPHPVAGHGPQSTGAERYGGFLPLTGVKPWSGHPGTTVGPRTQTPWRAGPVPRDRAAPGVTWWASHR